MKRRRFLQVAGAAGAGLAAGCSSESSDRLLPYVTPPDDKGHSDPEAFHRVEEYMRMARDLGAKVVQLTDRKVADALIRFAQQENISHVVFGQSARSRFDILLRGSVLNRFLSEVRDVTVQVVPMQKPLRRQ